jgi:DNA repair protein RadC
MNQVANNQPDYLGHRKRLRQRFLKGGEEGVADYELLELILAAAKPRGDLKPLAKRLLRQFKNFSGVVNAETQELLTVPEMGEACVAALKVIQIASQKFLREQIVKRPLMQCWNEVVDYCKISMSYLKKEQVRLLFLDRQNQLIADEIQNIGTVDHAPIYTREIVEKALTLGASALILVHNHPSGDPTPSKADIVATRSIQAALEKLGIQLHDHLIIGKGQHLSFKSQGLL